MKLAVLDPPTSLDKLAIVEGPKPTPGPGEVLARMRAASLNYRDIVVAAGGYGSQQRHDRLIPLSDGSGEIVAIGPGVTGWKTGDRVVGTFFSSEAGGALGGTIDGVACEYRVFGVNTILPIPQHLSFIEAATLPCAALTAWNATIVLGGAGPGRTVLTQGTGGVSLFALQFARMAGASVIATSSSAEKLDRLRLLGADHVINYKDDADWGQTARKLTGDGVDLVVEIGGGGTLSQSLRALRRGGTISLIGNVAGAKAELPVMAILMKNAHLHGITVGSREQFVDMLAAVAHHRIHPVVDRTFPLAELRAAFEHLKSGRHVGKVCIEI